MIKTVLLILPLLLLSCKEYQVSTNNQLNTFKCSQKDNCLSSMESGEANTLHFKMLGEDESQNIMNISRLLKKVEDTRIQKIEKNYLYAINGDIHLEFLANQKERKIHIRSQVSKGSLFGASNGKKLIEQIRFKYYQNDY